jgi:hypothetical protein
MDNKNNELKKVKKENDTFTKAIRKLLGSFGSQQDRKVVENKKYLGKNNSQKLII